MTIKTKITRIKKYSLFQINNNMYKEKHSAKIYIPKGNLNNGTYDPIYTNYSVIIRQINNLKTSYIKMREIGRYQIIISGVQK